MERVVQLFDELEDFYFVVFLFWEPLRRTLLRTVALLGLVALPLAAMGLAIRHPPLALAVASLVSVGLLYRAVVSPMPRSFPTN